MVYAHESLSRLEIVHLLSVSFTRVYEHKSLSLGRVGLSGPERVFAAPDVIAVGLNAQRPHPAATASDLPAERGEVKRITRIQATTQKPESLQRGEVNSVTYFPPTPQETAQTLW